MSALGRASRETDKQSNKPMWFCFPKNKGGDIIRKKILTTYSTCTLPMIFLKKKKLSGDRLVG